MKIIQLQNSFELFDIELLCTYALKILMYRCTQFKKIEIYKITFILPQGNIIQNITCYQI